MTTFNDIKIFLGGKTQAVMPYANIAVYDWKRALGMFLMDYGTPIYSYLKDKVVTYR